MALRLPWCCGGSWLAAACRTKRPATGLERRLKKLHSRCMADTLKFTATLQHFSGSDLEGDAPDVSAQAMWVSDADYDYTRGRYDVAPRPISTTAIPIVSEYESASLYLLVKNLGTAGAELSVATESEALDPAGYRALGQALIAVPPGGFVLLPLRLDTSGPLPLTAWGVDGTTSLEVFVFGQKKP